MINNRCLIGSIPIPNRVIKKPLPPFTPLFPCTERENAHHNDKVARITNQFQQMMLSKAEVGAQLSSARAEIGELREKYGSAKPEEVYPTHYLLCVVWRKGENSL